MAAGITTNIIEFNADLQAAAKKAGVEIGAFMSQVCREIYDDVVEHTPVDTGRARDNWYFGVGAPSPAYDDHPGLPHGAAIAPHVEPTPNIDGTEQVNITNNTPYVGYLEEGSSTQAPSGFAALAVEAAEWRTREVEKGLWP